MPTDYSTFVDFCADVLGTVTDIGRIHKVPLHITDTEELIDALTTGVGDAKHLKAWVIYRESIQDQREGAPSGTNFRLHRFILKGYHWLNKELDTETTFQNLIDDVLDAFETRLTRVTEGDPQIVEYTLPLTVRKIGHEVLISNFLVHACEIEIVYRERRQNLTRI